MQTKKFYIHQDNSTSSWSSWVEKFFNEFKAGLEGFGIETKFKSLSGHQTFTNSTMTEWGFPTWIGTTNSNSNVLSYYASNSVSYHNYLSHLLWFKIYETEFCLIGNSSTSSSYQRIDLYANYPDRITGTYSRKILRCGGMYPGNSTLSNYIFSNGTDGWLQMELLNFKNGELLRITKDGAFTSIYKDIIIGGYKINETLEFFPYGGYISGLADSYPDGKPWFIAEHDSFKGLSTPTLGDTKIQKYLIGELYYGKYNECTIGKLDKNLCINYDTYPFDTEFIIDGKLYRRLYTPVYLNSATIGSDARRFIDSFVNVEDV